jgi:hypothetical protein
MPNGHGIPLGCFVCKQYQKGEPNPLVGHCQQHRIEVDMDLVCADFDSTVNDAKPSPPLAEGILYAYVDVEGHGYPPPTERVPLAKITEYKDWRDEQRQQAWAAAQRQANMIFEQRK